MTAVGNSPVSGGVVAQTYDALGALNDPSVDPSTTFAFDVVDGDYLFTIAGSNAVQGANAATLINRIHGSQLVTTLANLQVTTTGIGVGSSTFRDMRVLNTDPGYTWSPSGTASADSVIDRLTFVAGPGISLDVDATDGPYGDAIRVTNIFEQDFDILYAPFPGTSEFTLANTTSTMTNVTGLLFDMSESDIIFLEYSAVTSSGANHWTASGSMQVIGSASVGAGQATLTDSQVEVRDTGFAGDIAFEALYVAGTPDIQIQYTNTFATDVVIRVVARRWASSTLSGTVWTPPPSPLTSWSTLQNIEDPAVTGDGMYGSTVAISDDGIYIFGGPGEVVDSVDTGGANFDGNVISYQESGGSYITPDLFSHTDGQNWPDNFAGDQQFFSSSKQIAVFGNGATIAVGASLYPIGGTSGGRVYIFDLAGTYSQVASLDLGGTGSNEDFGHSIAVTGDGTAGSIMAVGAPEYTGAGVGRVYIYENQVGTWTLIQTIAGGYGVNDYAFGKSVTLSRDGSTLAVGQINAGGAPFTNFFYSTYAWNSGTSEFDLIERFTPNVADNISSDDYIQAVLSDDGTILASKVGSDNAWVSTLSGGTWSTTDLTSLMPGLDRSFAGGASIGMNGAGNLIFVGSVGETGTNGATGVVHVLKNDGGWTLQDTVDNPDATDTGYSEFGRAVESNISGDTIVVGNAYADGGFGGGGAISIIKGV